MKRSHAIFLLLLLLFAGGLCKIILFLMAHTAAPSGIFSPDSASYLDSARAIVSTGRFAVSPEQPDAAQIMRTPGYPLFLAFFFLLFGENYFPIIFAQIVLSLGTVLAIYLLAARLWMRDVGLLAALFLSLDLSSWLSTQKILTETVFTFCLSIAMFCGIQALCHPQLQKGLCTPAAKAWLFLHGILLAGATLVRPITYYAIIPLLVMFLVIWRTYYGFSRKTIFNLTMLLLLPWIMLVGGWQLRNYHAAGTTDVSGIAAQNLLFYRGADILAQREGISFAEAQKQLGYQHYSQRHPETADWPPAQLQQHWKREGLRLICQHPLFFVKSQIFGLIKILLGTGEQSFLTYIGLSEFPSREGTGVGSVPGGPLRDIFKLPFAGYWQRWGKQHPWLVFLFFFTGFYLIMLYACMSFALWCLFRTGSRLFRSAHLILWCLMLYLLFVSAGPEAYSRFRTPLMPFFSLYAGYGLMCLLNRYS